MKYAQIYKNPVLKKLFFVIFCIGLLGLIYYVLNVACIAIVLNS